MMYEEFADFCFQLRQTGKIADQVPPHLQGINLADGYAIQDKLVAKLLAAHGGQIQCTAGPKGGTVFEFWLPAATSQPSVVEAPKEVLRSA